MVDLDLRIRDSKQKSMQLFRRPLAIPDHVAQDVDVPSRAVRPSLNPRVPLRPYHCAVVLEIVDDGDIALTQGNSLHFFTRAFITPPPDRQSCSTGGCSGTKPYCAALIGAAGLSSASLPTDTPGYVFRNAARCSSELENTPRAMQACFWPFMKKASIGFSQKNVTLVIVSLS